jgi:hypothetical protein
MGSEQAMIDNMRRGLLERGDYSADDLETHLAELRQLCRIAKQIEAETELKSAA